MENFRAPNTEEWIFFSESVTKVLKNKPILRHIDGKTTMFVGDLHGFYKNLKAAFRIACEKKVDNLIFLGDYVDRGSEQLRTALSILCAFAVSEGMNDKYDFIEPEFNEKKPFKVYALRGNHDDQYYCLNYDFFDELYNFYPNQQISRRNLSIIGNLFNHLPYMIELDRGTIGIHGGIPKPRGSDKISEFVNKLRNINTPCSEPEPHPDLIPRTDLEREISIMLFQMVWNDVMRDDFSINPIFKDSIRGDDVYEYNYGVFFQLAKEMNYKRLVRAHDATMGAYSVRWNNQLVHIFSAYPYFGRINKLAFFIENEDGTGDIVGENGEVIQRVEKPIEYSNFA